MKSMCPLAEKQLDNADTFGPGPIEDLMSPTSCITLDPEKENNKAFTHENKICPDGKGICKFRLSKMMSINSYCSRPNNKFSIFQFLHMNQ